MSDISPCMDSSWTLGLSQLLAASSGRQPVAQHAAQRRAVAAAKPRALQPVLFAEPAPQPEQASWAYIDDDAIPSPAWSEEDVVRLHCHLLRRVYDLCEPTTPLAEVFDILRWVFAGPSKGHRPFSFRNCVRVASLSPLSPEAYTGEVDLEILCLLLRHRARRWFVEAIRRYPQWVQREILAHPEWIQARLERNPQWLNETLREQTAKAVGDLFA